MLNLDKLKEIANNDPALLSELLTIFFQTTREDMENLQTAIEQGHISQIPKIAHHIKGGAAIVGAQALCQIAEAMEQLGSDAHKNQYKGLINDIQSQFNTIEALYPDF